MPSEDKKSSAFPKANTAWVDAEPLPEREATRGMAMEREGMSPHRVLARGILIHPRLLHAKWLVGTGPVVRNAPTPKAPLGGLAECTVIHRPDQKR